MHLRIALLVAAITAHAGCSTVTAHRLPIASNPLREEASRCEVSCRRFIRPGSAPLSCADSYGCNQARPARPDQSEYGRCLDSCPGATAIDGDSCPDVPEEGVVCVKTSKPSVGTIVGVSVAIGYVVVGTIVVGALFGPPAWLLVAAIH
jgi:hypothetical protein